MLQQAPPAKPLQRLFREEAVEEARSRLGAPVALPGISGWLLTLFFVALLATAAIFACTTHYAHKETVSGQVTPVDGSLRVIAARAGIAERVLVQEGQRVKAGQELIGISSAPKLQFGDSLSEGLRQNLAAQLLSQHQQAMARMEQIQRQLDEVKERRRGIDVDLAKLAEARRLQESRVGIQEETTSAARTLTEQGMLSPLGLRGREDALISARQTLAGLEREAEQQKSLSGQLDAQIARFSAEIRIAKSEADTAQAQMAERRLTAEATYADHLTAPVDGIVTALQARQGAPVTPNETLAIVIPEGHDAAEHSLEVELWAPSRAIGMVKPGARVVVMYDAFPFQTFGISRGVVREIASAPVMPSELPVPIETKEQLFRIRVKLERTALEAYGRTWPLTPGMRLSAELILEERTLFEWLLDPLRAATRKTT